MDDMISRQAAIDAVRKHCEKYQTYPIAEYDVEIILNQLPSVQPEQRWVSVNERLPDDYTDVLAWFEYFRYGDYNCLYQTYGIGDYSAKYDSWMINHETGWHKLRVLAWMPLPKPYQEEGD